MKFKTTTTKETKMADARHRAHGTADGEKLGIDKPNEIK